LLRLIDIAILGERVNRQALRRNCIGDYFMRALKLVMILFLVSIKLFSQESTNLNGNAYNNVFPKCNENNKKQYLVNDSNLSYGYYNQPGNDSTPIVEKLFKLILLPSVNRVTASFGNYYENFRPSEKTFISPSIKLELVMKKYLSKIGVEYRYDKFDTDYSKCWGNGDDWDDWYEWHYDDIREKIDYQLPATTTMKTHSILLTYGFGGRITKGLFDSPLDLWIEIGIGFGTMSVKHSPYDFKLQNNVTFNDLEATGYYYDFRNDFQFASESEISIFTLALNIIPYKYLSINFHMASNTHRASKRLGKSSTSLYSDGTVRTSQSTIDAAPFYAMITLSYVVNLFSW
jgi:hypothetical protein